MKAKNVSLCSVALIMLLTTSGCYTVFQKKTLDGKPPAEITEDVIGEYSGDIVFHHYPHQRWNHYLTCPWWEESIFARFHSVESRDESEPSAVERTIDEEPLYVPFPASEPTPFRHIVRPPSTPSAAPNKESGDIRRKSDSNDDVSEPSAAEQPEPRKKPVKPDRRAGPGGRR